MPKDSTTVELFLLQLSISLLMQNEEIIALMGENGVSIMHKLAEDWKDTVNIDEWKDILEAKDVDRLLSKTTYPNAARLRDYILECMNEGADSFEDFL